jgi:hypothetical protein
MVTSSSKPLHEGLAASWRRLTWRLLTWHVPEGHEVITLCSVAGMLCPTGRPPFRANWA